MARAVDVLRATVPRRSIGGIHSRQPCLPSTPTDADAAAAALVDAYWNNAFPDPQCLGAYPPRWPSIEPFVQAGDIARIARPVDWFGLNHYSPLYIRAAADKSLGFASTDPPADMPRTGIGWPIVPDAFRDDAARHPCSAIACRST